MEALIAANLNHIHITLDTLLQIEDIETAARLMQRVAPVWEAHDFLSEGRHYVSQLLNHSDHLSNDIQAFFFQFAGTFSRHLSEYTLARQYYTNGILAIDAHHTTYTTILCGLGETAIRKGQYELAKGHYNMHLCLSAEMNRSIGQADALTALGRLAMLDNDLALAENLLEQSQAISFQQDYGLGKGYLFNAYGELERLKGCYQNAIRYYDLGNTYFTQIDNPGAATIVKQNLAFAYLGQGETSLAENLLIEALDFWCHGQALYPILLCLIGLSMVQYHRGCYHKAAQTWQFARNYLSALGTPLQLGDQIQTENLAVQLQKKLSSDQLSEIETQAKMMTLQEAMSLILPPQKAQEQLTSREFEVLKLLAQGLTDREIASQQVISHHTVNTHLRNIYRKLQVNTRTEAIYKAHQLRLL